jgi:hypothetical protein
MIMVIYVILGTAMEELSMILLTVPLFFPLIVHLGLDPVWFGNPDRGRGRDRPHQPAGGHEPLRPQHAAAAGADPHHLPRRDAFVAVDCVRLAILVAFPIISTSCRAS